MEEINYLMIMSTYPLTSWHLRIDNVHCPVISASQRIVHELNTYPGMTSLTLPLKKLC